MTFDGPSNGDADDPGTESRSDRDRSEADLVDRILPADRVSLGVPDEPASRAGDGLGRLSAVVIDW
jgi:hypothetical protein